MGDYLILEGIRNRSSVEGNSTMGCKIYRTSTDGNYSAFFLNDCASHRYRNGEDTYHPNIWAMELAILYQINLELSRRSHRLQIQVRGDRDPPL